jgi:hypothetical protein
VPKDDLAFFERYARDRLMLFIVSDVELRPAPGRWVRDRVSIERTDGIKCERCWLAKTVSRDLMGRKSAIAARMLAQTATPDPRT